MELRNFDLLLYQVGSLKIILFAKVKVTGKKLTKLAPELIGIILGQKIRRPRWV